MGQRETRISVRVSPSASRDEVTGLSQGVLHLRLTAPPQGGKANAALVTLLARALQVPKSHLRIVRGHSSRQKVIAVQGLSREELEQRLGLEPLP